MTPKARAQEALDELKAVGNYEMSGQTRETVYEALALSVAIENITFEKPTLIGRAGKNRPGKWFVSINVGPTNYGDTPLQAILAAVEKVEKKS